MKIYGFPLSPFVRKVVVAVKEKGLDAEVLPSNPSQPDPEFAAVSPFHKIPAFRDGDFTLADSTAIVDKRNVSMVAPQALFMMNHPFVQERAAKLTERVLASDGDEATRVDQLYRWLFSRPANEREREVAARLLAEWRRPQEDVAADVKTIEQNAWRQYCQVLLCSNEFAFVD